MSSPTEVLSYRTLIANLAQRDLRARYKRSFLGWTWSLLNPAATLATYTMVFGVIMRAEPPGLGNGEEGIFALYLFCGLVMWNLISGIINMSIGSFQAAGGLLTRTYFPPETPVLAAGSTVVLQALLESVILLAVMVALSNVSWTVVLLIPIIVLMAATALGIGMVLAVLNIRYRDVAYLVGIALQVWFYATPIVYPHSMVEGNPLAFNLLAMNPVTTFVHATRQVVYHLDVPTMTNWIVMSGCAVASLAVGWMVFGRLAPRVIEEL